MKPSVITGFSTTLLQGDTPREKRLDAVGLSVLSTLLFLGLGGVLVSFFHLYALPIFMPLFALIGVGTCFALCFFPKGLPWSGLFSVGFLIFIVLFFLVLQFVVKDGWYLVLNQICDALSYHFGRIFPVYDVASGTRATVGLLLLLTPLTMLLALFCTRLAYGAEGIFAAVLLGTILLLTLVFDLVPPMLWLLLLVFAVVLLWCRRLTVKNSVPAGGRVILPLMLLLLTLAAVPFAAAWLGVNKDYAAPTAVKTAVVGGIHQWRYDGDGNAMPDGDFRKLGELSFSQEPALEVTMSRPQSLYVRGYVGETYTGSGWTSLGAKQRYNGASLFYWLHQSDFYGQSQLALVASLTDPNVEETEISIENIGANSQYIYVPYELVINDEDRELFDAAKIGDESVLAKGFFGQRAYSYTSLTNQVKRYHELQYLLLNGEAEGNKEVLVYLENEDSYSAYVYEHDLAIPKQAKEVLADCLEPYEIEEGSHPPYEEIKQEILSYLTVHMTYSEEGMPSRNGEDFFRDFMETYQQGYSVHYATAATLMFRYYGIPARYVEGYLITPTDIENVADDQTIGIDDSHSHAWVEIYQDGIGWVPFEVTPPYINLMEKSNALQYTGDGSEDESENDEDIPNTENDEGDHFIAVSSHTLLIILSVIVSLLLLLFITYLIYRLLKRRKALLRLKASFAVEDHGEAIRRMFAYTMKILDKAGLNRSNGSLLDLFDAMEAKIDGETALHYVEAALIQREAVFSRHELTAAQRKTVEQFMAESIAYLNDSSSRWKRFVMRRIQFLYG
ncbi:MAG TPA: transglutaminase-like domain-containing protein [Clostridiales bacterium]|nr:transglutaminase-like domain-containing protein [Clostridiales bacterium]